jgi:dihydrolipoamide dehydrogenase
VPARSAASRRRPGCRPPFAIKEAEETFGKLGVQVGAPTLDFATANEWKDGVVKQMTTGVASLFKANGVEWVKGTGRFKDANTIAVEGGEDVSFKQRDRRDRLVPAAPADRRARLAALRRLDRLLAQTRCRAARRPRRRHHRLRVRVDLPRFGSEVTIIEMLPTLIPQEDADAAKELAKQFGRRGIALHLEKQCTKVEDTGDGLRSTSATARPSRRPDARRGRPRPDRRGARPRGRGCRVRPAQGHRGR